MPVGTDGTQVTYSGVGAPGLKGNVGEGLAGGGVDDLDVENDVDALLVLGDVGADVLAGDV